MNQAYPVRAMIRILFVLVLLALPALAEDSVIKPGDIVRLRLSVPGGEVSISNFYPVDEAGMINLPLVGKIKVLGLGCSEAARVVDDSYLVKQIISHRAASVSIGGPEPFVEITGQVKSPGRIAIRPQLSLLEAITEAGGFTDAADQKKVKLVKAASGHVVVCNVAAIIRDPAVGVLVQAGDKVCVDTAKP